MGSSKIAVKTERLTILPASHSTLTAILSFMHVHLGKSKPLSAGNALAFVALVNVPAKLADRRGAIFGYDEIGFRLGIVFQQERRVFKRVQNR